MPEPAPSIRKRVATLAAQLVQQHPEGIRWSELHHAISSQLKIKPNTTTGSLRYFSNHLPPGIHKPERGIYAIVGLQPQSGAPAATQPQSPAPSVKEKDFYDAFAAWLAGDLEEATTAISVGGSIMGGKWGTPDVLGVFAPSETDAIKFTREVLAAEIKIDTQALIVAFGQACAYKLFAHRVYIVVPRSSNPADLKRLDALASVVGIGLVNFNATDPEHPDFQVMVRAAKHEPDYYYTNEVLRELKAEQRKGLGL